MSLPGEEQWGHHVGVGRHDQIVSSRRLQGAGQHRAVVSRVLPPGGPGAFKRGPENVVDQLIGGAATCAMAHVDAAVLLV